VSLDATDVVLALARGDHARIERLTAAAAVAATRSGTYLQQLPTFLYALGRSRWRRGDADGLRAARRQLEARAAARPLSTDQALTVPVLEALHLELNGERDTARERLAAVLDPERPFSWPDFGPELDLVRLHLEAGDSDRGAEILSAYLGRIEALGAPGLVVQNGDAFRGVVAFAVDRGIGATVAGVATGVWSPPARPAAHQRTESGPLTPREIEVVRLLASGSTNRDIADRLVVTERTVKAHLTSIFTKLGVSNRTQAAAAARRLDIV
jgi:DNA-binding CsgD family transcriptional regulator